MSATIFQFHKGAIRTRLSDMRLSQSLNFNSIKVRLEPGKNLQKLAILNYFNSIKVRLELIA